MSLPPRSQRRPAARRAALPSTLVLASAMGLVVLAAGHAAAYPRPGTTERVSLTTDGTEIGSSSTSPSISADGRLVAFVSDASDIVPGDTNGMYDVFVRDRVLGTTQLVSVGNDGAGVRAMSLTPKLTPDGRYVMFTTNAAFDPRDTNRTWDPYIRDLVEGTTRLGVVGPDGKAVAWGIGDPHMSDDARIIVFSTGSKVLPQDTNDTFDLYAYHRDTGAIELVSATPSGSSANGESYWNDISGNGRYAVFYSFASNVVANDTNGATDVFVRDLETDRTIRVSVSSDGTEGNASSILPDVSDDGRYIAFVSYASNLVPADANPINDVFVHDRVTRRTERVSVSSNGAEATNTGLSSSWEPSISGDGRYVAFGSSASNLVPDDTNGVGDFFVHDRLTGATERISIASDGAQMTSNNSSASPGLVNGRHIAFTSNATNLVPGDQNATYDVFVRDRGPEVGAGRLDVARTGDTARVTGWATFSGARLAANTDDDRDGRRPAPGVSAADVGGELVGASIAYRPEPSELVLEWQVTKLPGFAGPAPGVDANLIVSGGSVPSAAGAPAVVYGAAFVVDGGRYEVRGLRASATSPGAPAFAVFRCTDTCAEVGRVGGSVGTTGEQVRAAIPLAMVASAEGKAVSGVRAYVALGEALSGGVQPLDDVELGDATVPARSITAGVGGQAGPPEDFPVAIGPGPTFEGSVPLGGLPSEGRVWVRTCLGATCTLASRPVPNGA